MWQPGVMLMLAALVLPQAAFGFDLLTRHEHIRPTAAPGGLLYCLAKGHEAFQVDFVHEKAGRVSGLSVRSVAIETVQRRAILLVDGLIPVAGEAVPSQGRQLYVRSVGWVDHLVCIKGVPI